MTGLAPFRHPAFRPAFRLTLALWACGFALIETVAWVTARGDTAGAISSLVQFVTASALGGLLAAAVIRTWYRRAGRRRLAVALVFVGVLLAQGLVDLGVTWLLKGWLPPAARAWATLDLEQYLRASFTFLWVFALNLVLIYLSLARTRMEEHGRELAVARTEATQAQLALLRYQLNPHFLFNTLNAISTLVVTRRNADAEEMLTKLAGFLRASLAMAPDDYVRLDAELDILQEYLEIEGVRFGERLAVEFACEPAAASILVPSFLLQPLIENAVKYAVGPSRRTVTIRIGARLTWGDLEITIADDGDGGGAGGGDSAPASGGTGVGLRNVAARLNTLYGPRGQLEAGPVEGGYQAVVRLPARPSLRAQGGG